MVALTVTFIIIAQGHTSFYRNFLLDDPFRLWSDNVKKAPNLSIGHMSMGDQYWKKGYSEEAIAEYEKAIRLNRYMNTVQAGLAYRKAGEYYQVRFRDFDKASIYYRQAMIIGSTVYPIIWSSLADVELKKGHTENAVRIIETALHKWPGHHALVQTHVQILRETGNLVEAGRKLELILRKYAYDSRTMGLLAEIYRRQHLYSLSAVQWQRFLELNPDDPRPLCALIELYSRLNRQGSLQKMVVQFTVVKGEKSIKEMIEEIRNRDDDLGYRPDPAVLIPIIRGAWIAQK
jgi:tetratricopeptide (TPR) repeat protein